MHVADRPRCGRPPWRSAGSASSTRRRTAGRRPAGPDTARRPRAGSVAPVRVDELDAGAQRGHGQHRGRGGARGARRSPRRCARMPMARATIMTVIASATSAITRAAHRQMRRRASRPAGPGTAPSTAAPAAAPSPQRRRPRHRRPQRRRQPSRPARRAERRRSWARSRDRGVPPVGYRRVAPASLTWSTARSPGAVAVSQRRCRARPAGPAVRLPLALVTAVADHPSGGDGGDPDVWRATRELLAALARADRERCASSAAATASSAGACTRGSARPDPMRPQRIQRGSPT